MQVFICDRMMSKSAMMLDNKRLNKQIVEAFQIVENRLPNFNHPAYLFWKNYKEELRMYMFYLCEEYTRRFNKEHKCSSICLNPVINSFGFVPNLKLVLLSHKVNLLRKNYDWYSKFFQIENLSSYPEGYFWSVPYAKSSQKSTKEWIIFNEIS